MPDTRLATRKHGPGRGLRAAASALACAHPGTPPQAGDDPEEAVETCVSRPVVEPAIPETPESHVDERLTSAGPYLRNAVAHLADMTGLVADVVMGDDAVAAGATCAPPPAPGEPFRVEVDPARVAGDVSVVALAARGYADCAWGLFADPDRRAVVADHHGALLAARVSVVPEDFAVHLGAADETRRAHLLDRADAVRSVAHGFDLAHAALAYGDMALAEHAFTALARVFPESREIESGLALVEVDRFLERHAPALLKEARAALDQLRRKAKRGGGPGAWMQDLAPLFALSLGGVESFTRDREVPPMQVRSTMRLDRWRENREHRRRA